MFECTQSRMPGLPLVVRESTGLGCSCSQSRTAEQMCRQQSRVRLTPEEVLAAEESLSVYCKPVELYNILQRRAIRNPSFIQRSLLYKIHAKRRRRIQITLSLAGNKNTEIQPQNLFPLYVLLARPDPDIKAAEHSAVYRFSRAFILTTFSEYGKREHAEAHFIVPDIRKLSADTRLGDLTIILLSYGEIKGSSGINHLQKDDGALASFPSKFGGKCLWGKLHIEPLCSSVEKCVSLSLGHRAEMLSTVSMNHGILVPSVFDQDNCLAFQTHTFDPMSSYQAQVSISAQEVGAWERDRSPYESYTYDDVPISSLPHIMRLRAGNVLFNYRYYNNTLQKTEVTEDFSCPFCLVRCASFKGLRYHLTSFHDLFNFEFWVTEEYQAVNVSVRTDIWKVESEGVDSRLQTFCFRSKFKRRRRSKHLVQSVSNVHPHVLESVLPQTAQEDSHDVYLTDGASKKETFSKALAADLHVLASRHHSESCGSEYYHAAECSEPVTSSPDALGVYAASAQASTSNECLQPLCGNNLAPPVMLQFARTRKLSVERADPRNRALLRKRQFFHSHRAQPMALEQVLSDRDSEDEVDDDIADFEDRRMLDDFVDVTKVEKHIMHLWNSFVRKQRVLADGHIPWACEAFSRIHGQDLVQTPALVWCWRLFMVKLWSHSLLDARSMNNCNIILERYQNESSEPKQG